MEERKAVPADDGAALGLHERFSGADPVPYGTVPPGCRLAVARSRKQAENCADHVNQLALMDEYPEYTYTQSQPYLFQLVKTLYPELYGRIKQAVKEGKIIPEGSMWVEPDTDLPSGESLIRQALHGKRFFKDEFGVDNEMLWLPDVFGYSGNLPQIMKGCRIHYSRLQNCSVLMIM